MENYYQHYFITADIEAEIYRTLISIIQLGWI